MTTSIHLKFGSTEMTHFGKLGLPPLMLRKMIKELKMKNFTSMTTVDTFLLCDVTSLMLQVMTQLFQEQDLDAASEMKAKKEVVTACS